MPRRLRRTSRTYCTNIFFIGVEYADDKKIRAVSQSITTVVVFHRVQYPFSVRRDVRKSSPIRRVVPVLPSLNMRGQTFYACCGDPFAIAFRRRRQYSPHCLRNFGGIISSSGTQISRPMSPV